MALRLVTSGNAPSATFSLFDSVLDRSGRRQLQSLVTLIDARRGYLLAREGEISRDFLIVSEGIVKLWKDLPDGRRQIVAFRGPGDPLTLHRRDTPWPVNAQAVSACKYFRIQWEDLQRLGHRYPMLDQALFDLACDEVTNLQNRMLMLGRKTSEEKLASFILEFCAPVGSLSSLSRQVELPMRRPDIAQYLGLTTESVSREFSRFKHERFITMPRPSCIVILNRPALEAIALGVYRSRPETTFDDVAEVPSAGG
jgi:CRP/FNR family transcriptional regulator